MNKTPSVFLRNPENMHEMTRKINPLAQWVLEGEGIATRKYDGTCVRRDVEGRWWARREVKKNKTPPPNWVPVETDDITGKRMGWEPIEQTGYIKAFLDALGTPVSDIESRDYAVAIKWGTDDLRLAPGTYELCGPKINGNPEKYDSHVLVKHSDAEILQIAWEDGIDYSTIAHVIIYLKEEHGWEGIVWHHPDGRMAKMKASDYKLESGS